MRALTLHNLAFVQRVVARLRAAILDGTLADTAGRAARPARRRSAGAARHCVFLRIMSCIFADGLVDLVVDDLLQAHGVALLRHDPDDRRRRRRSARRSGRARGRAGACGAPRAGQRRGRGGGERRRPGRLERQRLALLDRRRRAGGQRRRRGSTLVAGATTRVALVARRDAAGAGDERLAQLLGGRVAVGRLQRERAVDGGGELGRDLGVDVVEQRRRLALLLQRELGQRRRLVREAARQELVADDAERVDVRARRRLDARWPARAPGRRPCRAPSRPA